MAKAFSRSDLSRAVAEKTGLTIADADKALGAVIESVSEMTKQAPVTIREFGKFELKFKAARDGRNPRTGETIRIAEHEVLKFSPSKAR